MVDEKAKVGEKKVPRFCPESFYPLEMVFVFWKELMCRPGGRRGAPVTTPHTRGRNNTRMIL